MPQMALAILSRTLFTAFNTPLPRYLSFSPSRSSQASCSPVLAPLGTLARPTAPPSSSTSTSTVGFPLESRTCRARTSEMIVKAMRNSSSNISSAARFIQPNSAGVISSVCVHKTTNQWDGLRRVRVCEYVNPLRDPSLVLSLPCALSMNFAPYTQDTDSIKRSYLDNVGIELEMRLPLPISKLPLSLKFIYSRDRGGSGPPLVVGVSGRRRKLSIRI